MNVIKELRMSQVTELVQTERVSVVALVVSIDHVKVVGKDLKTRGEFSAILEVEVELRQVIEESFFVDFPIEYIGGQSCRGESSEQKSSS